MVILTNGNNFLTSGALLLLLSFTDPTKQEYNDKEEDKTRNTSYNSNHPILKTLVIPALSREFGRYSGC